MENLPLNWPLVVCINFVCYSLPSTWKVGGGSSVYITAVDARQAYERLDHSVF